MPKVKVVQEVINTWEQIVEAAGPDGLAVSISWCGKFGRSPLGNYYKLHVRYKGKDRKTDRSENPPWWGNGCMMFSPYDSATGDKKGAALVAQAWVKEHLKYPADDADKWVRNKQGDYILKSVNDAYPLRKD